MNLVKIDFPVLDERAEVVYHKAHKKKKPRSDTEGNSTLDQAAEAAIIDPLGSERVEEEGRKEVANCRGLKDDQAEPEEEAKGVELLFVRPLNASWVDRKS